MTDKAAGNKSLTRRFYKKAGYTASDQPNGKTGFAIVLDGRPVKTPAKASLTVPTEALAQGISKEWNDQSDEVRPESMPLTQIAGTAIDKVGPELEQVRRDVLGYGSTDLLCYRANLPADLVQAQAKSWQPLLDWLARSYDAPLVPTGGIMAVDQPENSLNALKNAIEPLSKFELTAFSILTGSLGSLCLAFAVRDGELTPSQAWRTAFLDELWQAERWGEDKEAAERRDAILQEVENASRFFALAAG